MATVVFALTEAAPAEADRTSLVREREWLLREREHLLRELDQARAQAQALAEANRRMDAFLGIATHELRAPVTSGRLSLGLAARRLDTLLEPVSTRDAKLAGLLEPLQRLFARAEDDLDRLSRLVTDLLDVSRIQAGQGQLELRPALYDLRDLVGEAVEEQRQHAPTRAIRLHLPAQKSVPVWADADRIRQVVTNYLTNALKYSPDDRPVEVRVQVREHWARVSVRDEGPGLPREEQQRVWERFHRAAGIRVVSESERGAAQSLGLGLHISKMIVEQHLGRVGVRSAPGHGSTFWFALPAARADGEAQLHAVRYPA